MPIKRPQSRTTSKFAGARQSAGGLASVSNEAVSTSAMSSLAAAMNEDALEQATAARANLASLTPSDLTGSERAHSASPSELWSAQNAADAAYSHLALSEIESQLEAVPRRVVGAELARVIWPIHELLKTVEALPAASELARNLTVSYRTRVDKQIDCAKYSLTFEQLALARNLVSVRKFIFGSLHELGMTHVRLGQNPSLDILRSEETEVLAGLVELDRLFAQLNSVATDVAAPMGQGVAGEVESELEEARQIQAVIDDAPLTTPVSACFGFSAQDLAHLKAKGVLLAD
jgi:hypothetical protein